MEYETSSINKDTNDSSNIDKDNSSEPLTSCGKCGLLASSGYKCAKNVKMCEKYICQSCIIDNLGKKKAKEVIVPPNHVLICPKCRGHHSKYWQIKLASKI